jgi:hypothetical protein
MPYQVGLHNVGSYQVSGRPYITGSVTLIALDSDYIQFPRVTKSITILNHGDPVRVHFNTSSAGDVIAGRHYITVSSSLTMNVKCKELYVSTPGDGRTAGATEYELFAELTTIDANSMYNLTGSGLTDR